MRRNLLDTGPHGPARERPTEARRVSPQDHEVPSAKMIPKCTTWQSRAVGLPASAPRYRPRRTGSKVILIQDRSVLGGNNSSEVRVGLGRRHPCAPVSAIGKCRCGNQSHFWRTGVLSGRDLRGHAERKRLPVATAPSMPAGVERARLCRRKGHGRSPQDRRVDCTQSPHGRRDSLSGAALCRLHGRRRRCTPDGCGSHVWA